MPDDELTWVTVSDFRPGVITNTNYQAVGSGGNTGPVPGDQPGQAQSAAGCIALPHGGLAPLPGLVQPAWASHTAIPPNHAPQTGTGSANMIAGFFINGPLYYFQNNTTPPTQGDEIIVCQVGTTSAGKAVMWIDSLQINGSTATWNNILNPTTETQYVPFCTMTGFPTRAQNNPASVGFSCWALGFIFPGASSYTQPFPFTGGVITYPDVSSSGANLTSFSHYNLITSTFGEVFCHQNRIGQLIWEPSLYTSDYNYSGGNEQFVYTDPPNGLVVINAGVVFVQEDNSGYGAWGSQSASELFLVKNRTGGVVISGDLNSPTVLWLPGVTPTYGLMSRGASTPVGFVYASNNNGLWTWNGSNVSQKISDQLEDNFFINTHKPPVFRGPTVDICRWGDWIIVSNDWLYDTISGGWWQLPPNNVQSPHLWYGTSSDGDTLYAAIPVPTTTRFMDVYSRTSPSATYTWKSYPIKQSINKNILVKEIVVQVQGNGSVSVTLEGIGGSSTSGAMSPSGQTFDSPAQPVMYRFAVGLDAQDVTISIEMNGSGGTIPAPILHSYSVGFVEQNPVSST